VALMNLGTAEAWTLGLSDAPDAERHLREGAVLARKIGRPYLEVGCLAQLGFASLVLHSFATTQRRCREAIALAERYGWGTEPVIAPALIMLAGTLVWTGEFDECERWLQRTRQALQTDTGPDIRLLLHQTAGLLHAGRGRLHEALEELSAAEDLGSQLADDSRALASRSEFESHKPTSSTSSPQQAMSSLPQVPAPRWPVPTSARRRLCADTVKRRCGGRRRPAPSRHAPRSVRRTGRRSPAATARPRCAGRAWRRGRCARGSR